MKTMVQLMIVIVLIAGAMPTLADTLTVDCDNGESLTQILAQAAPGDMIEIRGTCQETVQITTDQLTLMGQAEATLDGGGVAQVPVVGILGARGVSLKGLKVQNAFVGVAVIENAQVSLEEIEMSGNSSSGLSVSLNSVVQMTNSIAQANGIGVTVASGGIVQFGGVNTIEGNMRQGILVANGTVNFFLRAPQRELNVLTNGAQGMKFLSGRGSFYGGIVNSSGNTMDGILLQHNSAVVKGTEGFPFSVGVITTNMNGGHGIWVESGSDIASDPELTTLTSQGNTLAGLRLDDGRATIGGGTLSGNVTADIQMAFQSKLTLEGNNTIGTFDIEPGSICRDLSDQALCPSP